MGKKATVLGETQCEDGTVILSMSDGTTQHVDNKCNPLTTLEIPPEQILAWQKMPKEEALKEALTLFNSQGLTVQEKKGQLDIIRFIADLTGATVAAVQAQTIVAVEIHVAPLPEGMNPIEIKKV